MYKYLPDFLYASSEYVLLFNSIIDSHQFLNVSTYRFYILYKFWMNHDSVFYLIILNT